ncbi:MAG TPA: hypothetical protein VJU61_08915 [Polyangiaceae bacterium]|nr:hypothetical protein [Polyangiaceae bacterium]
MFTRCPQSLVLLGALALVACHSASQPAPEAPPPAPEEPAGAAAEQPATTTATSAPVAENSSAAPPAGYAMCHGQHVADATAVPRSGPSQAQLAPAFLDEMAECSAADAVPADVIARATDGTINAKGDCEFASIGVSCHYHSGSEFVTSSTAQQTPGQGELHCIFPSDDPKSPHVYGGHVACRDHALGEPHGNAASKGAHATHEVHAGASCPVALLHQLDGCKGLRCCDDGTLTNPIAELAQSGRNDVRPDFRICEDTLAVDCELLDQLTVHAANSPALGGVGEPAFVISHGPSKKTGKQGAAPHKHL